MEDRALRRCSSTSERIFSIERLARPTSALLTLVLAAGMAPAFVQTPATNNSYDVSTGSASMQPDDLGLNRTVVDGGKRHTQARKGDNMFSARISPLHVLQPQPDYAKYPVYVDVIGDMSTCMRFDHKAGEIDGAHGEYVPDNAAGVHLVVDEYEDDGFLMEESDDNIHVAGTWEGTIGGHGVVRGAWTDVTHDGYTLPFALRPIAVVVIPPHDTVANSDTVTPATPMTPLIPAGPGQIAPPAGKPTRPSTHWQATRNRSYAVKQETM